MQKLFASPAGKHFGPAKPVASRLRKAKIQQARVRQKSGTAQNPSELLRLRMQASLRLKDVGSMLGVSLWTVHKLEKGRPVQNAAALEQAWLQRLNGEAQTDASRP